MVMDNQFTPAVRAGEPGPLGLDHSHIDPTLLGQRLHPTRPYGDTRPNNFRYNSVLPMTQCCR